MSNLLPEAAVVPSTFNQRPSGVSALKEVLERQPLQVNTWQKPYRLLDKIKGTMLMIRPQYSPEPYELDLLLSWVKAGNNLVFLDIFFNPFYKQTLAEKLQLRWEPEILSQQPQKVFPAPTNDGLYSHVGQVTAVNKGYLQGGVPLLSESSKAVLVEVPYGKGTIMLGTIADVCSNSRVADQKQHGNFQLLANWLMLHGHAVYFNEYCHGHQQGTTFVSYLAGSWVGLVCVQLLLIFTIYLASSWQRFGQAMPVVSARRISNLEHINALADTYRRAKAGNLILEILDHNLRLKLSRALCLSSRESNDDDYCQAWTAATGHDGQILKTYLQDCKQALANADHVSEEEFLRLCQRCAKISGLSASLISNRPGVPG